MFLKVLEEERKDLFPVQKRARKKALSMGFPNRKSEEFRYLPLKELETASFTPSSDYSLEVSSDKVELLGLEDAMNKYGLMISNHLEKSDLEKESFFSLINKGMGKKAYVIFVHDSVDDLVTITEKIEGGNEMFLPTLYVFTAKGVTASFHHNLEMKGEGNFINRRVEVAVERGAHLTFYETADISYENNVFFHFKSLVKKGASLEHYSAAVECRIFRNELKGLLLEEMASCSFEGFWNVAKNANMNILAHCSHLAEHTVSRQHFQGVSDGSARSSFEGQIYVDKIAQKTDSYQLSKHLLISEKARGFSKPNLEVFADDVIASHGATVSCLNDEELFYLTSRGISKEKAASHLKRGFISFFLDKVKYESVKNNFKRFI